MTNNNIFFLALLFFALTGCSTLPQQQNIQTEQPRSIAQRIEQASSFNQWKINGKIAFISPEKRESATLFWQVDQVKQQQALNLTTFLGINVLSLSSNEGLYRVEVDGEEYHSDDLEQLIYQLTGLTLPTEAMQYWLKGLAWSAQDHITYDKTSLLPSQLLSYYHQLPWQVSYADYQYYAGLALAKKITIKQGQLTIKIAINQWQTI